MLRSNATSKMLTYDDIRRRPNRLFDNFTEFFLSILLSPIPDGRIDIIQLNILGPRGTGKTTLIEYLADLICSYYGENDVNISYCEALDIAVQLINSMRVQLVILDDASGDAASRKAAANVTTVQDHNKLRHRLREKQIAAGIPIGGLIIQIIAWQRKNDLERAMREADLQVWKGPPTEPEDQRLLADLIGYHYMKRLKDIAFRILKRDQSAKSTSVGMISVLGRDGVGIFRSGLPSPGFRMPEMITTEKFRKRQLKDAGIVSEAAVATKEYTPADVLAMYKLKMSMSEIAKQIGKSKTTVHRWLKEATDDG